jgi:hypothetical protein
MENKQGKLITIVLAILLVLAIGYGFYLNSAHNELTEGLEAEKTEVKAELDQLIVQYDAKIAEGTTLNAKLVAAREDIVSYRDSLNSQEKTSYSTLRKYKNRVSSLQKKNKELFSQVEELTADNTKLNGEIVEAKATIESQDEANADLTSKNEVLLSKVSIGAVLSVGELQAVAMKKSSNGILSETSKYKKTDAFRVSFKINKNELTESGDKLAYLVIKDTEGNIVAPKGKVTFDGTELYYSDTTTIEYKNVETDVVLITDIDRKETQKGVYTISAILNGKPVGETTLELKGSFLGIF